jgi:tungstate transport system substrate-binding protein
MFMDKKYAILIAAVAVVVIAAGAYYYYTTTTPTTPTRLILSTTTSTVDTGLLAYLKSYFDAKFNANLTWLSLGTGAAMTTAARGDADALLVHDRVREDAFVASGNGTMRVTVMYNDFVIIGPSSDPAGIAGENATMAMMNIASAGALGDAQFVSRTDGSGTHALEQRMWTSAGITGYVNQSWYWSANSGMAATIRVANEKGAYTITDRGTYLKLKAEMNETLSLFLLCENDTSLLNPYGMILLNSTKYTNINSDLGQKFLLFMISTQGQQLIANYTVNGQKLFFPVYGNPESIGLPSENSTVTYLNGLLSANGMQ